MKNKSNECFCLETSCFVLGGLCKKKEDNYSENKHAYLIVCHNSFKHLEKVLLALDDARNDIYIYIYSLG